MDNNEYWQAVVHHDEQYNGKFVYAVRSTGVYCRPSCHSRRPKRENVHFFAQPADAEQAGFRPCRRCQPDKAGAAEPQTQLIQEICRYLEQPRESSPTLDKLGQQFNLSPYHLQRTFKQIVGVSPRQYAAAHRLAHFKEQLKDGKPVTEALYEAGYQSPSTVYGQVVGVMGMTPRRYQRGGQATHIAYAVAPCPLGWLLLAATEQGICAVRLGDSEAELAAGLRREFPAATLEHNDEGLRQWLDALLDYLNGTQPRLDLPLDVQVTAFQQRVYDTLRAIPYGSTRSYGQVAQMIGQPKAVRAVAHACATNPTALVVPCHRVVHQDGSLGGYRWGIERKQSLLDQEAQHKAP